MKPTRATQPYRKGARQPGSALAAMLRGRTLYGQNPADVRRVSQRKSGLRGMLRGR